MNIYVERSTYNKVIVHLKAGKKIAAIKAVRNDAAGTGLREAKDAVEKLQCELGLTQLNHLSLESELHIKNRIKKVTVDMGDGDIEVDLETMEMIALTKLQRIGLNRVGEIIELIEALRAFSNGERIGVIEPLKE